MTETSYPLDDTLYQKNLGFWERYDPKVCARLRQLSNRQGQLFCPESTDDDSTETPVDLMIGSRPYFAENAWSRARRYYNKEDMTRRYAQFDCLKSSLKTPEFDPTYKDIFLPKYRAFIEQHSLSDTAEARRQNSAQCVVFGLGLGCLLHHLVMATDTVVIIILEESLEMLHHSLYIIDYTEIFETMRQRDGHIELKIKTIDEHDLERINDSLRHHKFSYIQNSRVIVNDQNTTSPELIAILLKKLVLATATKGYLLDQIVMVRNLCSNVYRHKIPLLSSSEIFIPQLPCFIIGNGPSLEQSIDTLRRYRNQAIFISCGTALGSLLARDLRPDIHVELENIWQVPKILRALHEKYNLQGIHFVHTSTLDPAEPGLFETTTQFHRPGISNFLHSSHVFAKLVHSEPTVTNIGIALAGRFGFSEIYLFGVDMGTINPNKFHASKNVYDDTKQFKKLGFNKNTGSPDLLPMPFPANFGGSGYSSDVMLFSRPRLEDAIMHIRQHYRCRVYNCSDGLHITGAIPKLPHTLKLDISPARQQEFMAYFARAHRDLDELDEPAEHFESILSPEKISESFDYYRTLIDQHTEEVDADTVYPLYTLFTALEEELDRPVLSAKTRARKFHKAIISGSYYLWTQKYIIFDACLPDQLRTEAGKLFVSALRDAFDVAEQRLLALAAEFDDIRR